MLSDRRKIQNLKASLRRLYTGASQTTGPLVVGKFYRITEFKTGDDFSNVGVPTVRSSVKGHTGTVFQATGTTPTVWTKGSKLTELKVADLRARADALADDASAITLTSTSFEGGSQSGEITRDPEILPTVINELLAEMDPEYVPETGSNFPRRSGGYTVLMG